ncbi:MAG: cytochrome c oxidase subunit 3 [Proteobacteria bacterium]|nr:cytochrome c oxidase subunit 3 [Pseudomonadota bacterium]
MLFLSSVAMQRARASARRDELGGVKNGLFAAGLLTLGFLAGQLFAWQQLGYNSANPASVFFYLLTALHGLHLLGGLVAWIRTTAKVSRGVAAADVRLSVELCAFYWHFLLLVWLILFGLLLAT